MTVVNSLSINGVVAGTKTPENQFLAAPKTFRAEPAENAEHNTKLFRCSLCALRVLCEIPNDNQLLTGGEPNVPTGQSRSSVCIIPRCAGQSMHALKIREWLVASGES